MNADLSLLLPQLILGLTGLALVVADTFVARKRLLGYLGVAGVLLALLALVPLAGRQAELFQGAVVVDRFSVFFQVVILSIAGLVFLAGIEYVEARKASAGELYTLVTLSALGMLFMVSSLDLLTLYVALELMSISFYIMTGTLRGDAASAEGSIKFLLMGAANSAVLLFGISLLYGLTGTTYLPEIAARVQTAPLPRLAVAAMIFLVAGIGFKVAMVPFHMWVPDAYQGAPTPITGYLSVGSKAASFGLLTRLFVVGLPALVDQWSILFMLLAFASMTFANVTAIVQHNVKRMMAYSSIAQAGNVMVGLAVLQGSPQGMPALLYYLLAYGFFNMGAFAVISLVGAREGDNLDAFRGLARRSPWAAAAMVVFLLSLVGIPPTAGFFAKLVTVSAAMDAGVEWLAVALVVNSAISVPYYFGVIRNMYLEGEEGTLSPLRVPGPTGVAIALATVFTLAMGVFPARFWAWAEASRLVLFP